MKDFLIVKASGDKVPFSESKYRASLRRSGASEKDIEQVFDYIKHKVHDGMTTKKLYHLTYSFLKKMHREAVGGRYHLKRALMRLGPTGFPFERFIAALLSFKKFQTLVGQEVRGICVTHEIDIIATKGDERLMVECKFHNRPGERCAIQTALYVKARYDDVKEACEKDSSCNPKYSDCWLVTNTKFTSVAADYGVCVGMFMFGWAHPRGNGLEHFIDTHALYPITCLSALSQKLAKKLFHEGIIFCHDLMDKESLLQRFGLKEAKAQQIVKECREICQHEGHQGKNQES